MKTALVNGFPFSWTPLLSLYCLFPPFLPSFSSRVSCSALSFAARWFLTIHGGSSLIVTRVNPDELRHGRMRLIVRRDAVFPTRNNCKTNGRTILDTPQISMLVIAELFDRPFHPLRIITRRSSLALGNLVEAFRADFLEQGLTLDQQDQQRLRYTSFLVRVLVSQGETRERQVATKDPNKCTRNYQFEIFKSA